MRLDKIKFAKVVQFIGRQLDSAELTELDNIIDINVEPVLTGFVDVERVNELLKHLNGENGSYIEAIKAYRALTNAELKESKDIIEKYRVQRLGAH